MDKSRICPVVGWVDPKCHSWKSDPCSDCPIREAEDDG